MGKIRWNDSGKCLEIMGEQLEVTEAPEASDIIWENMSHTQGTILMKKVILWVVVVAILNLIVYMFINMHKPL